MSTTTQDPKTLLESLLNNLGYQVTIEEKVTEGSKVLDLKTADDSERLIGRKGQTLLDLQYILNRMLFQHNENAEKVQLDVGGYRFSEDDKLVDKAKKSRRASPPLGRHRRTGAHELIRPPDHPQHPEGRSGH